MSDSWCIRTNSSASSNTSSVLSSALSNLAIDATIPDDKPFPFTKLPPELRHKIYAHVLTSPDTLHVSRPKKGHEDHFIFCTCPHADIQMSGICTQCLWEDQGLGRIYLDTAIFHVSEKIRDEAFRVMLAVNTLYFFDRDILSTFVKAFSKHTSTMLALVLSIRIFDEPLSAYDLKDIRTIVAALPNLQHLTIYARVSTKSLPGFELHQSGVLNFFRPFARLPLITAKVRLIAWPNIVDIRIRATKPSSQTLQKLEVRAVRKLLGDPSAPEERQISQPNVLREAIERKKEDETPKKFGPNLAPGVIIARMGVPDREETVSYADLYRRSLKRSEDRA